MNSQLILASTPGKSLRRFRKDNNHLEKFDTYEIFANGKGIRQWTTACMYIFIDLIEYEGWSI